MNVPSLLLSAALTSLAWCELAANEHMAPPRQEQPVEFSKSDEKSDDEDEKRQKKKRKKKKKGKKSSFRWGLRLGGKVSYDSNIFNLSDDQIDRLEDDRPDDEVSGRFDDMDSPDDIIISARARVSMEFPLIGGRDFTLEPGVRYDYYTENTKRSHPRFTLGLEQDLGGGHTLGLHFRYAPQVFKKNYLADATDTVDSVSADERVYDEGVYDEGVVDLLYRARLWKAKKKAVFFRQGQLNTRLGYANRSYESPFENRDRDTLRLGLGFDVEVARWLDLDVGYLFEYVVSPGDEEVVIRDETDFGVDFNGDLDALDQNIRTEQKVDRSRLNHGFRVGVGLKFAENWRLRLGYRLRLEDFQSDEPFDLTYRDREDLRHEFRVGLAWEVNKVLTFNLEGRYLDENSNRDAIDDNEEREYDRYIVSLAMVLKF